MFWVYRLSETQVDVNETSETSEDLHQTHTLLVCITMCSDNKPSLPLSLSLSVSVCCELMKQY